MTEDRIPIGFAAANVDPHGMVGASPQMRELRRRLTRGARTHSSILLLGERGVGKELAGRAIHAARAQGKLAVVNSDAATVELSWHEKLVGTQGGTLFIGRLEALSFELQATLARALDLRRSSRPSATGRPVVVASMRAEPTELVARGLLRAEVVAALDNCTIRIPPLRDRLEDLPDLVSHFLGAFCQRHCACIDRVTPAALGALSAHPWPGNVRELRRALDHAIIYGCGGPLDVWDLPPEFHALAPVTTGDLGPSEAAARPSDIESLPTLAEMEAKLVAEALRRAAGNKTEAARALGISRHKLYDTLRRLT